MNFSNLFQMETLTDLVQSKFRDLVVQGSWLTDTTKKLAEEKIKAIIHNIGYPGTYLQVWKFQKFSIAEIFCETNFDEFRTLRN